MKRERRNRIVIAWVLLLTLLPLGFVKATHFHAHEREAASDNPATVPAHSDEESCPICNFFLSPFIETEAPHLTICRPLIDHFIAPACQKAAAVDKPAPTLRAPPYTRLR